MNITVLTKQGAKLYGTCEDTNATTLMELLNNIPQHYLDDDKYCQIGSVIVKVNDVLGVEVE